MATASGIRFHEVMSGGFAQGALDPARGERAGARAGTRLELRVTADIQDVGRFVQDPEHAGRLHGTVTFAPIGADRAAAEGRFRLFAPAADPNLKLMAYRVSFRARDAHYCLDGAKHVGRHSVLGAWADTTTLWCRLHAGGDTTGPVTAAGVLHLTPLAFARQLASFRTPGAARVGGSVRALAGFFSFFSRELLDTYVVRRRGR